MHALPIVNYEGELWFYDARLRQIRTVQPPLTFTDLDDFEVAYFDDLVAKGEVVQDAR
jgi:hypothetical protein